MSTRPAPSRNTSKHSFAASNAAARTPHRHKSDACLHRYSAFRPLGLEGTTKPAAEKTSAWVELHTQFPNAVLAPNSLARASRASMHSGRRNGTSQASVWPRIQQGQRKGPGGAREQTPWAAPQGVDVE
jgi:hypothetical protein